MKVSHQIVAIVVSGYATSSDAQDKFNYRSTSGRDYGPNDWDEVDCTNLNTCPGWPDKLLGSVGWSLTQNECRHCPIEGNSCGQHRQSPIDLHRDRAIADNANWKECPDWHWMQFKDGTCDWEDMLNSFEIGRHALQIHTPLRGNGDINCANPEGERKFPKLDYSKGFPDWWYLSRTDIKVPSEHVQEGKRYAAEVHLSHFYEIDHYKNKLGKVSIFMQDFEGEPAWHYLDKLICQWRKVEEEKRAACGLDPAPVYKMCELFRGQVRADEDLDYVQESGNSFPTHSPLVSPDPIPIVNYGGDPEEFRFPLGLCEGDCDFATDCAPGLLCHRRDAFEEVPGCIGGESDPTNTDYCVFDPYGAGFFVPTGTPTEFPTASPRPTLTPLPQKALTDYGGDPPLDKFPLKFCEGDCDNDEDCEEGLMCFQRNENDAVPGCIGGESDIQKTDYCILDPYGPGYTIPSTPNPTQSPTQTKPTTSPTNSPTKSPTSQPTTSTPSALPTELSVPSPYPTEAPVPSGPRPIINSGWEPPTPLRNCEGDCDDDSDCGPGMFCYQRNVVNEPVPGCIGGETDASLTDYCTFGDVVGTLVPSSSPTENPTVQPTSKPVDTPTTPVPSSSPVDVPTTSPVTSAPSSSATEVVVNLLPLNNLGWSPQGILSLCEGDCDDDSDCGSGLICFQRDDILQSVPGCLGGETDATLTDYCIQDPNAAPVSVTSAPTSDASAPSPQPSTKAPTTAFDPIPLINRGWSPPPEFRPLGRCEGDCDVDTDCGAGFKCFQRYLPNVVVPGCLGGEVDDTLTDYCIVDPQQLPPTEAPVVPPTDAPVVPPTDAPAVPRTEAPVVLPTDAPVVVSGGSPAPITAKPSSSPVTTSTPGPTGAPAATPTSKPTSSPTSSPTDKPTSKPTDKPTSKPTNSPTEDNSIPPAINCDDYDANYFRMCKDDSCCESTRSSSTFCHESYSLLGSAVESACHHCCLEERGVAKAVGPAAEENPNFGNNVPCESLENSARMCKAGSCCEESGAGTDWCKEQYALFPNDIDGICWYCCFPSKVVDFDTRRLLGEEAVLTDSSILSARSTPSNATKPMTKEQLKSFYNNQTVPVGKNDVETHDVDGRPIIVREENFEEKGLDDDEEYFEKIHGEFQRRMQQQTVQENYDDVYWWPYEWLLKVGTEYYFRYEGTQTVPPCYDTAHWRVLKDPIRVAPHQMRELERLMAWRLGNNCQSDTAGKQREGNPNAVDVNRPLQSYHKLHRKVFCECQDWPSKFPQDREWCRNWKNRDPEVRFYDQPYNWPSDGFDFL